MLDSALESSFAKKFALHVCATDEMSSFCAVIASAREHRTSFSKGETAGCQYACIVITVQSYPVLSYFTLLKVAIHPSTKLQCMHYFAHTMATRFIEALT